MMQYPVIIIGAGPAGLTAALQLKRSGITPLVLEKDRIGGLLLNAHLVENYPGFPNGISGKELVSRFRKHLNRLGIKVLKREVKKVSKGFRVITNIEIFYAKTVIIATGTKPRSLVLPNEPELIQEGKLYYEIKDLPSLKRQDTVAIVGGGDAGFDYALNLADRCRRIYIIFRANSPRCLPLLLKRANKCSNIKIVPGTKVTDIQSEKFLTLTLKKGNNTRLIRTDYILVAVGREPNVISLPTTNQKQGLFWAGDIKRGDFRQAGIAVGDGLLAAMQVTEYLKHKKSLTTDYTDDVDLS